MVCVIIKINNKFHPLRNKFIPGFSPGVPIGVWKQKLKSHYFGNLHFRLVIVI